MGYPWGPEDVHHFPIHCNRKSYAGYNENVQMGQSMETISPRSDSHDQDVHEMQEAEKRERLRPNQGSWADDPTILVQQLHERVLSVILSGKGETLSNLSKDKRYVEASVLQTRLRLSSPVRDGDAHRRPHDLQLLLARRRLARATRELMMRRTCGTRYAKIEHFSGEMSTIFAFCTIWCWSRSAITQAYWRYAKKIARNAA